MTVKKSVLRSDVPKPSLYYSTFQIWLGGTHPTPVIKTPSYTLNIDSQLLQATGPVWENATSNFSKIESNLSLQSGFYRRYFTISPTFLTNSDRWDPVLAANADLSPNTGQWEALFGPLVSCPDFMAIKCGNSERLANCNLEILGKEAGNPIHIQALMTWKPCNVC